MDFSVILLLGLLLIIALLIPWFEGLLKNSRNLLIAILALALAFAARAWFLDYVSGDYDTFLVHWVDYYRTNGGFAGLANSLGNYNIPYLYFLALFSYLPINDLYLIKLLSIAFDIILAFSMMKLTGVFTRSVTKRLAAFLITLLLPTVVLNGAMWGQCDSIYVAFALLSLWMVLSDRPKLSMVFMALSFGFKLQAIFLMPVFLVMLFAKKIKFRQLFVFPLAYIALILPAVLLGRPFMDAITLYFNQAGSIGSYLNYNSPSIFAFFQNGDNAALSAAFIALALLFVLAIFLLAFRRRGSLNNEAVLGISLLFVVGIPFLLPHMHDRYFFMADVLSLLPAVLYLRYSPITALTSFASFLCYFSYLTGQFLLPLSFGAVALLGVLLLLFTFTLDRLNSRRSKKLK